MTANRNVLWGVATFLFLALILAAITIPSLLRSRAPADQAAMIGRLHSAAQSASDKQETKVAFGEVTSPVKKLIHNAELSLSVRSVTEAASRIQQLAEQSGGDVEKYEMLDSGTPAATLIVRVPSAGFSSAVEAFKKVATRTDSEKLGARDVTREFYDDEAHLRNLHAEEQQYLAIMKQAGTIKDTLQVSEKLSDVRDRIERLQAQIQVMSHDIEMSQVAIILSQPAETRVLGAEWKPLDNAKTAMRELLSGLGDWLDWIVAVLIRLPLVAIWTGTVGFIVWVVWKVGRWGWLHWFKATLTPQA